MLAAGESNGSESSHQAKAGRQDSVASQDLGLMLDEVNRLDQMRSVEADPQQKEELKRQMQAEMKALLTQVQKTKAQVKSAQIGELPPEKPQDLRFEAPKKPPLAQGAEDPRFTSGQPRVLTDRTAFEEGYGRR